MEKLKRFAPPGMILSGIRRWTVGAIAIAAMFSLCFLTEYVTQLAELKKAMEQPVFSGLAMKPFADMIVVPMLLFRLAPVVPLLHIPSMYGYYSQETRSIYVMKRLQNPFEMHLRCLALPAAAAVLVIVAGCAVYLFYQFIYYTCTPEILLPASL